MNGVITVLLRCSHIKNTVMVMTSQVLESASLHHCSAVNSAECRSTLQLKKVLLSVDFGISEQVRNAPAFFLG